MKEKNKKAIILLVIGIATLLITVIGTTFAYFSVTGTNSATSTGITTEVEDVATISLSNETPELWILLSPSDMSENKIGTPYYATADESKNYETEEVSHSVAKALVTGGSEVATYTCTFDLNVEVSGEMFESLQKGDATIAFSGAFEEVSDLTEVAAKRTVTLSNLSGTNKEEEVKVYVVFNNTGDKQNDLAGKSLEVKLSNTDFLCNIDGNGSEEPTPSAEAFAVYSADDNSLNFYKRSVPSVGDTFEGKTVTAVYTGIEDTNYSTSTMPEWPMEYGESITSVSVVDEISPISTFLWFGLLGNCTTFDINNLDTSNVTNMSNMFDSFGTNVETINLDLSNLDTSSVQNMASMFANFGSDATTINLNVSNWDTPSLLRISSMFYKAGTNASEVNIIGLNTWNTSTITNMNSVFDAAGTNATTFNIGDISGWDTSKVITMLNMFRNAGVNADWSLDLSGWKVPLVESYSNFNAGVESKVTAPTWAS